MTREEAIADIRDNIKPVVGGKSLDMAIEALEQEPCTDAISRQAAIDACLNGWNKDYKEIVEEIRALPPVTPAEKVGQWIDTDNYYQRWKCSECGCHTRDARPNYCSNCGAKMQEVEE